MGIALEWYVYFAVKLFSSCKQIPLKSYVNVCVCTNGNILFKLWLLLIQYLIFSVWASN